MSRLYRSYKRNLEKAFTLQQISVLAPWREVLELLRQYGNTGTIPRTNINHVTACFHISTFEKSYLKSTLKPEVVQCIHSLSRDGIKCWSRKEKDERFQGNYIASPKALTIQYIVLFSHLTVQVPTNTRMGFRDRRKLQWLNARPYKHVCNCLH